MTQTRRLILLLFVIASTTPGPATSAEREADGAPRASQATSDYVLGAEDVVQVFVWKEPDLSAVATVRPDGRIALPLVGELMGAGKTSRELQVEVTSKLKRFIDQPAVTVIVKEIHSPKISVLGEVRRPGRFLVPQPVTILDAIAMSGGFTEFADRGDVEILRPGAGGAVEVIAVDVKSLIKDGSTVYLQPQDTIYVH